MGTVGFAVSLLMGKVVERFNVKTLLLVGVGLCMIAPVPSCLIKEGDINLWVLPPIYKMGVMRITANNLCHHQLEARFPDIGHGRCRRERHVHHHQHHHAVQRSCQR